MVQDHCGKRRQARTSGQYLGQRTGKLEENYSDCEHIMSVKITDNTPLLKSKNVRAINLAIRLAMDDIDREAFRNTPKDKGELRKNIRKQVGQTSGTMTWASDYAAFQERGYSSGPIRKYTTSGTGPNFAKNAVAKVASKFPGMYFRSMT